MASGKKIGFIINPIAGTRSKDNIPNIIDCLIDKEQYEFNIRFTEYAGHGHKIAKEMAENGYYIVASVGGDGTMNEIASALIHTNTALALVPCGSGNGLARHLGVPLAWKDAINLINNHKIIDIDYGTANDAKFFCTCGVGFDAHIGNQFAQAEKRGFFTYLKSILNEFYSYKPKKYKFKFGESKFSERAFLVTFANASQYGNNAFIAPEADIQDGLIDVCILKPFPMYRVMGIGLKLMTKKIMRCQYVEIMKTNEIQIKRKRKDVFHFDGEPQMTKKKIKIKAVQRGLKIIVPINSKLS